MINEGFKILEDVPKYMPWARAGSEICWSSFFQFLQPLGLVWIVAPARKDTWLGPQTSTWPTSTDMASPLPRQAIASASADVAHPRSDSSQFFTPCRKVEFRLCNHARSGAHVCTHGPVLTGWPHVLRRELRWLQEDPEAREVLQPAGQGGERRKSLGCRHGHLGSCWVFCCSVKFNTVCALHYRFSDDVLQSFNTFNRRTGSPTHYATLHQRDMLSKLFRSYGNI